MMTYYGDDPKDPKPAPEGDKDYQAQRRAEELAKAKEKVEVWKKGEGGKK